MIGKSSLPVTSLPAESRVVPSGTIMLGAEEGACSRLGTLTGCGVPSISSGGISVVSGMLPDAAGVDVLSVAAVVAESEAPWSPQPEKMSALPARVRSAMFFMMFY